MLYKGHAEEGSALPGGRSLLPVQVAEDLRLVAQTKPDVASVLGTWDAVLADELPSAHVRDVAELTQDCCVALSGLQLQRRTGGYPYLDRGNQVIYVDDYSLEGDHLLVCCIGTIATRRGTLFVQDVHDRCMPSKSFICVTPKVPADFAYLHIVLGNLAVSGVAGGCREALTVSVGSLGAQLIPWPEQAVRENLVSSYRLLCDAGETDLANRMAHAFIYGHDLAVRIVEPDLPAETTQPVATIEEESFVDLLMAAMDVLFGSESDVVDTVTWTPSLETPSTMEPGAFVSCFPRNVDPEWCSHRVDPDDPRWTLGIPPRNDAAYAWLQQALALTADGGRVLALMPNHILHSTVGRMLDLRNALAQSGLVRAVIALPSGVRESEIFGYESSCLLVLEKGKRPFDALMVDARFLGVDSGRKGDGNLVRKLGQGSIAYVTGKLAEALQGASAEPDGHSRFVTRGEVVSRSNLLTPWTYLA